MPKQRKKGEGSVEVLPNGKFNGRPAGRDPVTGKRYPSRTFETRKEAESYIKGFNPEEVAADKLHTLAMWFASWLKTKEGKVEDGTYVFYEQRWRLHIKPKFGHIRLQKFTRAMGERLLQELRNEGKSIDVQRKTLTTLKAAFAAAADCNVIERNPVLKIKPPKAEHKRRRPRWTADEASRFLAAPTTQNHRLYALFYLWLGSGIRKGEIVALQWPDVRWEEQSVRVEQSLAEVRGEQKLKATKTGKERTVPVSEDVMNVLAAHRDRMKGEGWDVKKGKVFPNDQGGWLWQADLCKTFDRLQAHVDVPRITPYALRHTHGSMLARDGQSLKAIQERLGHKDAGMTMKHYLEADPGEGVALARRSAALLKKPAPETPPAAEERRYTEAEVQAAIARAVEEASKAAAGGGTPGN
jgi:integrase